MNLSREMLLAVSLVVLLALPACASDRSLARQRAKADVHPPSSLVRRPIDQALDRFGKMLAAYTTAEGIKPVTIEIDFLGNDSGNDQLPSDLGQFARDILARTGQIQTYRTLPAGMLSSRTSAIALPQLLKDVPQTPRATFRLVGEIERATQVMVKYKNGRLDGTGGGGHTSTDSSLTGDRSLTVTAMTIGMTLEQPDRLDVPGATAEYRIDVNETDNNNGFSLYVGGNGFSFGSELKITQDWADAVYDALAMSIIQIVGNALNIPYYECSPNFAPDSGLQQRVRSAYRRTTQSQLERQLKRYMIVAGYNMNREHDELTADDRNTVANAMRQLNLPVNANNAEQAHSATVELLMTLWQHLDYEQGSARVEDILADSEWKHREAQEKEAALNIGPSEFGWPTNEPIVVLDLSRITVRSVQGQIVRSIQLCAQCGEIKTHPQKPLLGIRTASKDAVLQAIAMCGVPLQYEWEGGATMPRLLLVPVAAK